MSEEDVDLRLLFSQCDPYDLGYIGRDNLRDLCSKFNISHEESDTLFAQLDHDQDGKVNFADFAWGFREFYTNSDELHTTKSNQAIYKIQDVKNKNFNHEIFNSSGPTLAELYERLQINPDSRYLIEQFENAIKLLVRDINVLEEKHKKQYDDSFKREKERHISHLKRLEEELDLQVANVEKDTMEKARGEFEKEKRKMEEKMTLEISELQAHLKFLEKINQILTKRNSNEKYQYPNSKDLDFNEMKKSLIDTKTNLLLLRTELSLIKNDYHNKCQELFNNQLDVENFKNRNHFIEQQLVQLQEANLKLQDDNYILINEEEMKLREVTRRHSTSIMEKIKKNYPNFTKTCYSPRLKFFNSDDQKDSGLSSIVDSVENDDKSLQEELEEIEESFLTNDYTNKHKRKITLDVSLQAPEDTVSTIMADGPIERTFRIVLAGDAAVGKSCFINRFCSGKFMANLGSTLGVDFQIKNIRINNKNITLQLWDTAGQERFRAMTKSYFRRADGVILLYDITNERSFINIRNWIQSINDSIQRKVPLIICGNKSDLIEKTNKFIDIVQAERLASENDGIFFLTSCKSGSFVLDSVLTLTREMLSQEDLEIRDAALKITTKNYEKQTNCCK